VFYVWFVGYQSYFDVWYFGYKYSVWVARRPPGYAFIEFDDRRDALDAIQALDGKYALLFYQSVIINLCVCCPC